MSGTADQRLFLPFLDLTDMVMCRPAGTSLRVINQEAAQSGLRFPLVCEPQASLGAHMAAVDYASNSARFGPFVDNILGMNWELKSGKVVRIGERVIKSATGYDLLRFLLHSDGRYGRATDYVLRLRPLGGETAHVTFTGTDEVIEQICTTLRKSSWIHWIDAVDLCLTAQGERSLHLDVDCALGEGVLFLDFFQEMGREGGADLTTISAPGFPGFPALSLKTTVPAATSLARLLVREHGGSARVLCVNGVAFYYPPPDLRTLPDAFLADLARQCAAEGGHLQGLWAPTALPMEAEAAWAAQLENAWNQL